MNIKVILLVGLITAILNPLAYAQDGIGVGVIVGEPTGISLKKWLNDKHAVDAAAAWSFSENDSFQFHADYLIHNFTLLKSDDIVGKLPVYFGLGGRLKLKEENNGKGRNDDGALFGVRIPFGISYLFTDLPVDIFMEIVPILDVAPDTEFEINAGIGVRFYFR